MNETRKRNLIRYVIPAILSNTCFFLFSVVDGIFVGQGCGTDALGAINLALPFIMIANVLNTLVSIGGSTIVAVKIGRKDTDGAKNVFMHSVTAILAVGILLTLAGTVFTKQIAILLGARDGFVILTQEYIFWWAVFFVPCSLNANLQCFCRNDGAPGLVAKATIVSTVCNIFLDWLMVFPLHWGLMGAAVATGLSQTLSMLVVAMHFLRKKGLLTFRRFKPDFKIYQSMVFRGLPDAVAQFSTPVTTLCLNHVLLANYGAVGVNAFSVMSYIGSFSLAVFFGACEGLQPLFGRSYGAKNEDDLRFYLKAGTVISLLGSVLCFTVYLLWGDFLCTLFGADAETARFTVANLWKYTWAFIPGSISTLLSAYFYSTEHSGEAIILNVLRSFVLNSAIIIVLPILFGKEIVWYTFGIYESLVMLSGVGIKFSSERRKVQCRV